ncbi:MAG: disulfide oxidoreductase [Rhodospirillaceae bacterium]|nr:disulfide oxidoreductase [Rhodospirillaceae bacterium]
MTRGADSGRVFAVLGPTNTGKTHLAMDRMAGHASGIIGFPLRLLARENYDRLVRILGRSRVALVTGEEKIVPGGATHFVCTVESMPLDREADFLAVDEIQLAADPERGHVFTHRLLNSRGLEETMVLGAETIRPLIRRLVPEAEFVTRTRFSRLTYAGPRKLSRLPPRSAIVAFSTSDVYQLAEMVRRQRGGTAIVLGALSPRTRNAQVGMYQAGEVDYLVATDAIGMGLNMDIDHVAFARLGKFDGRTTRRLRPTEIAQIAGRAGRHTKDGTFGTTDEVGAIDEEVVEAVETHTFDPLQTLMWRNADLDFRDPRRLLASLEVPPPDRRLRRKGDADDVLALTALMHDAEVLKRAIDPAATRVLWDVCQIPDFRKMLTDAHTRLLAEVYRQLAGPAGRLDTDWIAGHLSRLDRTDGDIDGLVSRIAHIRTWTYITHRADWLADPKHWQARSLAIEDRLSDALHARLTQRFVDRRSAALVKSLRSGVELIAAVARSGEVLVEGEFVGRLDGFRFTPDAGHHSDDTRAMLSAARRALRGEIARRVRSLDGDDDSAFCLGDPGGDDWATVLWHGRPVATLAPGSSVLSPVVRPLASELLEAGARDRVARRLQRWLDREIAATLQPLLRLAEAPQLAGAVRGLAYQLQESLGVVARGAVAPLLAELEPADKRRLSSLGIRVGRRHVYLAAMTRPRLRRLVALLWCVSHRLIRPPPLPADAAVSARPVDGVPPAFYAAIGFVAAGGHAIRVDRLDALVGAVEELAAAGPFQAPGGLAQLVGCPKAALADILVGLGYRRVIAEDGGETFYPQQRPEARKPRRRRPRPDDASPFAKLKALDNDRR